jgi:hypothetical protein
MNIKCKTNMSINFDRDHVYEVIFETKENVFVINKHGVITQIPKNQDQSINLFEWVDDCPEKITKKRHIKINPLNPKVVFNGNKFNTSKLHQIIHETEEEYLILDVYNHVKHIQKKYCTLYENGIDVKEIKKKFFEKLETHYQKYGTVLEYNILRELNSTN